MNGGTSIADRKKRPKRYVTLNAMVAIDAVACLAGLGLTAPILLVLLPVGATIPKLGAIYMFKHGKDRWVAASLAGVGTLMTLSVLALTAYFFLVGARLVS